ncbi:hypothetical protein C8J56DRAFT_1140179 [Mycena floridula]|nr:hypothetical protein C8J56DRAFT_1140179 [Mycena floridula]
MKRGFLVNELQVTSPVAESSKSLVSMVNKGVGAKSPPERAKAVAARARTRASTAKTAASSDSMQVRDCGMVNVNTGVYEMTSKEQSAGKRLIVIRILGSVGVNVKWYFEAHVMQIMKYEIEKVSPGEVFPKKNTIPNKKIIIQAIPKDSGVARLAEKQRLRYEQRLRDEEEKAEKEAELR